VEKRLSLNKTDRSADQATGSLLEEIKMKKMIASLAAVALFAAPALAEPTTKIVIPKGAYTVSPADVQEGTRGINDDGIYNNLHSGEPQTQYLVNNQGGLFIGDDLHMTSPGTAMTTFRWVYSDNGTTANGGGTGHSSTLVFSHNTANDGGSVLNFAGTTGGATTAAFLITGLPNATLNNPGGGWLITVGLPGITTGPDAWVGLASNSTTPAAGVGLRGTSLSPAVGSSHNLHWAGFFTGPTATSFFTVPNGGSFRMVVLPEPAVAGLLALGGLVMLRRRARA
jgi:hypothetical protein